MLSPQSSHRALEQETRERATVLQTEFENFVHADAQSVQNAKKGTLRGGAGLGSYTASSQEGALVCSLFRRACFRPRKLACVFKKNNGGTIFFFFLLVRTLTNPPCFPIVDFLSRRLHLLPVTTVASREAASFSQSGAGSRFGNAEVVLLIFALFFFLYPSLSMAVMSPALQSFLRAYTTYPAHLKHVFHIRSLHLGHTAKSFGLRDAPQGLSAAVGGAKSPGKGKKQSCHAAKGQKEAPLSRTDAQGKQGKKR